MNSASELVQTFTVYCIQYSTCYKHATGLNDIVRSLIRLRNLLYKHLLSTVHSTVHAADMIQTSMILCVHEFSFGTCCTNIYCLLYTVQYMLQTFIYCNIGTRNMQNVLYNNVYFPRVIKSIV